MLEAGIETHPVSDHPVNKGTTLAKGIISYYVATAAAAASVCLHFYTLSATKEFNSFEELCIMRVAAENSFARVLNLHGGAKLSLSHLVGLWVTKYGII